METFLETETSMEKFRVNVHLVNEDVKQMSCDKKTQAEDLCINICRELKIAPITLSLFALREKSTGFFYPPDSTIEPNLNYELRIRFKVPDLQRLENLDPITYNYYFLQLRGDVLAYRVPEIIATTHKAKLLGMAVADMNRVMLEEKLSIDVILKSYKKYIPNKVYKLHSIFVFKPLRKMLKGLRKLEHDIRTLKSAYLDQFHTIAPNYLSEEFSAIHLDEKYSPEVKLLVAPFHEEQPGIKMCSKDKKEWSLICGIEELLFFSIKDDATVEIHRKNGGPFNLKFEKFQHATSFIGICDGYYRLMVRWTFNLCKNVFAPSLDKLKSNKCHGPVGGVFSYRKLYEKCNNRPGSYILRQCQKEHDVYYIDFCSKNRPQADTRRIDFTGYQYKMLDIEYDSFEMIRAAHQDPDAPIYMKDCIPPSDYDKSPLLLCVVPPKGPISHVKQEELEALLAEYKNPHIIHTKDVQFYTGSMVESRQGALVTCKGRWNIAEFKNLEVSLKLMKKEKTKEYLSNFKEEAGQWAYLKSNAIVKLYGLILLSPAMVMEYLPLGPLDKFLREKRSEIKVVDLVEAAATLTKAVYVLSEAKIVHGYIRCRKLLVSAYSDSQLVVKLSNPGLHSYEEDVDYHWVPPECYHNYNTAQTSISADIWACATTFWEIFSCGLSPAETNTILITKSYQKGDRLRNPNMCPPEIYKVMLGCWLANPQSRLTAQAVMRDVNSHLHQVYNSRRAHQYESLRSKENITLRTDTSLVNLADFVTNQNVPDPEDIMEDPIDLNAPIDRPKMQCIYDLGPEFNLVLEAVLGRGFYGIVYKGTIESKDRSTTRAVAVKTLLGSEEQKDDFLREIKIMHDLSHKNIVQILNVLKDPVIMLVMEYMEHGSLQTYLQTHQDQITACQLLKFAQDIADGMHYLGTKNIVHRDLAARNILVEDECHVRIADFGLAQNTGPDHLYRIKTMRDMPLNGYAPESVISNIFTHKSDVWSYGVLLWEMFSLGSALPPSWDLEKLKNALPEEQEAIGRNRNACFPCPKSCPHRVYSELLWPCLNYVQADRPSFLSLSDLANQLS